MLKINDSMLRLIQTILFMLLIILSCSQLLDTGDFGSSYGIQAFDDISFAIFTGIVLYFLFVFLKKGIIAKIGSAFNLLFPLYYGGAVLGYEYFEIYQKSQVYQLYIGFYPTMYMFIGVYLGYCVFVVIDMIYKIRQKQLHPGTR